jgi:preprotein translocase subunit SecG
MRRVQKVVLFVAPILALLVFADPALAVTHGGEGLFGPTNDAQVTNAMFFLLGFFPVIIIVFSLIQSWLDHRKHKKIDAEKAAAAAHPFKGGW